jgi:hypothetical protein
MATTESMTVAIKYTCIQDKLGRVLIMYVLFENESLLIPAVVQGEKSLISNIVVEIKASKRGEVPRDADPVTATMTVEDYTSEEVTNGYLFSLVNSSALVPGIYYVNFKYSVQGNTFKGEPKRITVKESVV